MIISKIDRRHQLQSDVNTWGISTSLLWAVVIERSEEDLLSIVKRFLNFTSITFHVERVCEWIRRWLRQNLNDWEKVLMLAAESPLRGRGLWTKWCYSFVMQTHLQMKIVLKQEIKFPRMLYNNEHNRWYVHETSTHYYVMMGKLGRERCEICIFFYPLE